MRNNKQAEGGQTPARRPARLIAVGNRLNLAAAASEASFVAELERIVGLAAPYVAGDRPTLVVLGELLGLPLAVSGPRGRLSRRMKTGTLAIGALAVSSLPRVLHYRRCYRGISLVRALFLALADTMYRPLVTTLGRLAREYQITLAATTAVPRVARSTDPAEIRRFGGEGARAAGEVWLPSGPEVYNTAFLWGPDGALLGTTDKVFITEEEKQVLDFCPGRLADVRVFETPAGRVGLAISLDAFTPEFLHHLDRQGAEIVIQNDANDLLWAGPCKTWDWQPQEWLNSVMGSVQAEYPHLRYNVCAMQTGNFFDTTFDGQSSIIMKSARPPDPAKNFVGNEGFYHTVSGQPFTAAMLAVAPWVAEDPGRANPALSLKERRAQLAAIGQELRPGGKRANQFCEAVIWADVG